MSTAERARRYLVEPHGQRVLVLAALLLAFFANLGGYPLFDLDEGAFSEATREMVASGQYGSTTVDGEPRYDKPILTYWAQAAFVHVLGPDELAFRLPSALAALAWGLALWGFVRERGDTETATSAALIVAFGLGSGVIGRVATADGLLNLWLALAFMDMVRWYEQPRRNVLWRTWLWLALGFLTKGPVAVGIPAVSSLIFFSATGRWRDWFRAIGTPVGWIIFLAVNVPWYIIVYLEQGASFFREFFIGHNLGRFTGTMEGHGGELWYYLVALPVVLLPFTGWFLAVLPRLRNFRALPADERFGWTWFALVFVLVSVSATQLPHYVLYGLTPLALALARHRGALRSRVLAFLPPLLLAALLLALPALVDHAAGIAQRAYERELLARGVDVFGTGYYAGVGVAAVAGLAVAFLAWPPARRLLAIGAIQSLCLVTLVTPALADLQQVPVREAALRARDATGPVIAWGVNKPSFSVYRRAATPHREPRLGDVVFTRAQRVDDLEGMFPDRAISTLYRDGGIALLQIPADS